MLHNRIRRYAGSQAGIAQVAEGFAAIPGLAATNPQQAVYQLVYEQARKQVAVQRRLSQLRQQPFRWN